MKPVPCAPLPVFFASRDGHTLKIASFLADELRKVGFPAYCWNLEARMPRGDDLPASPLPLIVVAPIRYGFHLKAADDFIKKYRGALGEERMALLSVNLTARKEMKRSRVTNAYLRKWLRTLKINPVEAFAVAGKLDYPRYSAFDRLMIRFIMTITGGPTDPSSVVEFTAWDELTALAARLRARHDAVGAEN